MKRYLNEVTIEVIQTCSSNCIFCSSYSNLFSNKKIPFDKICEIIDFCKAHGAATISISGGEPLLYDRLVDVIKYCSKKYLNTTIYSSGNVKPAKWDILSQIDSKNIKFIFNYPSVDNDIYQELICSKDFHINDLNQAIVRMINNDIPVEVHIVPNRINIGSLYDSAAFLKSIGVRKVSFLRLVPQGRAQLNKEKLLIGHSIISKEINRVKQELRDDHFTIRGGVPFSNLLKTKCECIAGISKLIFRYDGVVFPCEAFKEAPSNESYVLGSIYNDPLDQIWNNHPVHSKLKLLKKRAIQHSEPCPAQMLY